MLAEFGPLVFLSRDELSQHAQVLVKDFPEFLAPAHFLDRCLVGLGDHCWLLEVQEIFVAFIQRVGKRLDVLQLGDFAHRDGGKAHLLFRFVDHHGHRFFQ
mgnify:CR=1 FL=1